MIMGFRTWRYSPNVLSFIKCRIKTSEIHAGVVRGELPVDLALDAVSGRLPGRDLVAQDPEGGDAAVEALTDHDAELDLGDVEPTAVLGRVDELEAVPQGLGLGRRKGLVESAGAVGVQVVHHQCDSLGAGVALGDVVEKVPQSVLVLRAVTLVMRRPARGSVAMNTLQLPQRRYW